MTEKSLKNRLTFILPYLDQKERFKKILEIFVLLSCVLHVVKGIIKNRI